MVAIANLCVTTLSPALSLSGRGGRNARPREIGTHLGLRSDGAIDARLKASNNAIAGASLP